MLEYDTTVDERNVLHCCKTNHKMR